MQTTPKLGMTIPSGDGDPFDELPFVNALLEIDAVACARLADMTLAAPAGAFDFQSIPATYAHLLVAANLGSDGAGDLDTYLRVNGISSASYLYNGIKTVGGAVSYPSSPGATQASVGFAQANAGQVMLAPLLLLVPHYTNNDKPQCLSICGGNGFNSLLALYAGSSQNAGAVNRLTLFPSSGNFRAGSRATLYGLA